MASDDCYSLRDHFLIAMPQLKDPYFGQSVTYICEHNDQGAMGIVINRPMNLTLGDVFKQIGIPFSQRHKHLSDPICAGGPVEMERGFVLHRPPDQWDSSIEVSPGIHLTTSKDILQAMAEHQGPEAVIVALGYAGWEAGQLEQEIQDNAWLTTPADPTILFELPLNERWQAAASTLGVNLALLSSEVGHS